jgi:hypothetical protein
MPHKIYLRKVQNEIHQSISLIQKVKQKVRANRIKRRLKKKLDSFRLKNKNLKRQIQILETNYMQEQ